MNITPAFRTALALGGLVTLCCCVSAPTPPPPAAEPPPPPVTAPEPLAENWRDWPIAAGDWSYQRTAAGSIARFGQRGEPPLLTFRCDLATKRIFVGRATSLPPAQISGQMRIHTTYSVTDWPVADGQSVNMAGQVVAVRTAGDGTFDHISFSRGRIGVEAPGARQIAVPRWPEMSRVIEDCRG